MKFFLFLAMKKIDLCCKDIIKEYLLPIILSKLRKIDFYALPPGLDNGKIGFTLLNILTYGMKSGELEEWQIPSVTFFKRLLLNSGVLSGDFLTGYFSFPWCIKRLANLELTNAPDNIKLKMRAEINNYRNYYKDFPFQFKPDDRIYPLGICYTEFYSSEETVDTLTWKESMIHRIRDCEKILTVSADPLHDPYGLSDGILHSMLYFFRECWKYRIFPYKCLEMERIIKERKESWKIADGADSYILQYFIGNVSESEISSNDFLHSLARVGLFSFIYRVPEMFISFLSNGEIEAEKIFSQIEDNISMRELIGIILGFYSIFYYGKN